MIIQIGRNDKCYCGSGNKYKKCCLNNDQGTRINDFSPPPHVLKQLLKEKNPEPYLNIVPSVVWNGFRCRAIWNKVYYRPIEQTFHEFLIDVLLLTFGKEWNDKQLAMEHSERHIVMKWKFSYADWTRRSLEKNVIKVVEGIPRYGAIPTGEVKAFLQLAYDLYCLQIVNKLPESMIRRLRNYREFQGVRYEIAVAAMVARAGFEIQFFDRKLKAQTQCEFIAIHKKTGINIGIEAKSRRRKGVLNEEGVWAETEELRGDVWKLFNKARKQKPEEKPFIIFLDLNLPPLSNLPEQETPLLKDLHKMIFEDYGKASFENRDPFNMIIITNYSYYYAGNENETPNGECYMALSDFPETEISQREIVLEIFDSVRNYREIPEEV
ncbi:SEC-C metal-binding domain-containing protein [Fictibacillus phosphorivorans]|uniref:SEC-C metal-binding domain-containing protein n=1 Tax=Fictibacillus phosphorivorans TaxID=1221500 RepID=UPI0012940BA7|nr:SEC-C metal-binding domain-containing protein [Fictibacillus phosphorivorans]MQR93678.1 hypothetical protein [Fictibacillus phosphorivorans]